MMSEAAMIAGAARPPGVAHAPCVGGCGSILNARRHGFAGTAPAKGIFAECALNLRASSPILTGEKHVGHSGQW